MFKLQVMVSEDMVKKIDSYASDIGVSRSALCAVLIGQGIRGFELAEHVLDGIGEVAKKEIVTSGEEV